MQRSDPSMKGKWLHLNVQNGDVKKLDCGIHDILVRDSIDKIGVKGMGKLVDLLKQILSNKEGIYYYTDPAYNDFEIIKKKSKQPDGTFKYDKVKELRIRYLGIK